MIIRILNITAFFLSVLWLILNFGMEPLISAVLTFAAMINQELAIPNKPIVLELNKKFFSAIAILVLIILFIFIRIPNNKVGIEGNNNNNNYIIIK